MHEASLVQGLLDIVLNAVREHNEKHADRPVSGIREITCGAGLLACFEEQTLRACFEMFAEGTLAEDADLKILRIPLRCQCGDCGNKFELLERHFACPVCGSSNITFSGGNGLILQAINVDCEE